MNQQEQDQFYIYENLNTIITKVFKKLNSDQIERLLIAGRAIYEIWKINGDFLIDLEILRKSIGVEWRV